MTIAEPGKYMIGMLGQAHSVAMRAASWKYIAIYYALACGFSWLLWAPLVLGQEGLKLLPIAPPSAVIVCLGTLGPLSACYVTHRLQTGNWRAVRLFSKSKPRLLWLIAGPLLVLFCFFVVFPAEISSGTPNHWHWHIVVLTGILVSMFSYNLLGGPLFEEFGWRGFLQSRMQQVLPPWIAALLVGTMWAAWHLPLFFVQSWSSASPSIFLLTMVGLSPVIAFGFNGSNEAVLVAILMHSAFNASPRFLEAYLSSTRTRDHPSAELLIAVAFLFVGSVLSVTTRGRLAHSFQPSKSDDDPGLSLPAFQDRW